MCRSEEPSLLRRQAEVIVNSLSCWVLSTQRGLSFFYSPSFFFLLSFFFFPAVHNSAHFTGCPEALDWIAQFMASPSAHSNRHRGRENPSTHSQFQWLTVKCKQEKRDNYYKTLNQHFLLTLFGRTNSKSSLSLVPHRLDGEALPQLLWSLTLVYTCLVLFWHTAVWGPHT